MTKQLVPQWQLTSTHLTEHTKNVGFQVQWATETSYPKGVTFKQQKKGQRIMNFSLHLQTIFTFVKTKQNNFKEKNPVHIYKNCTRHCLVMYLNSTTVDLFWLKGVLETVHAHIHIYIYQGPWSCQKLQKQAFCLFLMVVIFFSWVISDRSAPTSTAPS